jgi:hypothetical protein
MKWLVPASLVVLPILAACGDDEEAISDAPTTSPTGLNSGSSAPAFADATVTIRATATLGPTFGDAPELFGGFREFAPLLMDALASGDTGFTVDRADRVSVTCEGIEQAGPCSGVAAGEVRSGIPGSAWRSDAGGIFSDEDYAMNLSRYREASRPELSDEYGTGALRLFALGSMARQDGGAYEVITTSITNQYPSTGYSVSEPFREAHVFYFHHNGAGWRFDGEKAAAASITAVDWLSGTCSQCYDYWEPWPS